MAFNGSGVFNRLYSWVADRDAGTKILAQRHDDEDDGFADGLTNCLTKDGQTLPTADLPMNSKKLTGLAAGSGDGHSVRYEQVPKLATSNRFTVSPMVLTVTDGGASAGPSLRLFRDSASPAANDRLAEVDWRGNNSAGTEVVYATLRTDILDPTSTSEDSQVVVETYVAGTSAARMRIADGMYMVGATGQDQGTGTFNATAVYDDGVLLTPYVLEQARDSSVDIAALDAKVPDRVDESGNIVEERRHEPARRFLARIDTEYDPLDIDKFTQHWKDKAHLSPLVNPAKAVDGKVISMGSWIQRLIETVEIQAVHIDKLNQRVKALEAQ